MDRKQVEYTYPPMVPEVADHLDKYATSWQEDPPYILFGMVESPSVGRIVGILAFAGNEFHAHLLQSKMAPYGLVKIEKTEKHPDSKKVRHFSVVKYLERMRNRERQQQNA